MDGVVQVLGHRVHIVEISDRVPVFVRIGVAAAQVVRGRHALRELGEEGVDVHFILDLIQLQVGSRTAHKAGHRRRQVHRRFRDLYGVIGEHILLRLPYVRGEPVGEREHEADADDADAARDRRDERTRLFCEQVAPAQKERRPEGHARLLLFLLSAARRRGRGGGSLFKERAFLPLFGDERVGVVRHLPVEEAHDARGIALCKLGVVRDHDDQPLARDLLDEFHDLHARLGVERARRLVREQDLGVVDERARNGDALHLPARELVRLFIELLPQPHALERLFRARLPLCRGDAREGQRELYVAENGLVRDEVVALEHEPDGVVAVGVPVPVLIIFCRNALDDEVAVRILVQPADDVQKGRLSAARGTENGDELFFTERERNALERVHGGIRDLVILYDAVKF